MPKHTSDTAQLPLIDAVPITLADEQITFVDPMDADLASFRWCCTASAGYPYPQRRVGTPPNSRLVFMHQVVMERILGRALTETEMPDHADGNPLNNRRLNLRLATKTQNAQNAKRRSDNVSGYKGVSRNYKSPHPWRAVIKVNGKQKTLGYFDDPKEAYAVYCEAARLYFGEFARVE